MISFVHQCPLNITFIKSIFWYLKLYYSILSYIGSSLSLKQNFLLRAHRIGQMNTVKITYFLAEGKINSKTETLLRVEFIVEIAKSPFFNFSIWLCRRISFCFIYENLSFAVQCFFRPFVFLFETEFTTFSFLISIWNLI